jgi:Kef-type K+ transport system membrane component KefB
MYTQEIFTQLSLVLVIVAAVAGLMRLFRQPLILGYIIAGILVGPTIFNLIQAKEAFEGFSQIGIALLLFIIGLGMNATIIKSLGKVSLITAAALFTFVGGVGAVISLLIGFNFITSALLGIALFFSSTILILKVLSDKHEVSRLHGQIAIGIILVDDIVAMLAIVFVAAFASSGGLSLLDTGLLFAKALGIGLILFVLGKYVLPKLAKKLAKSQELLFIFTVAWGFGIASLFHVAGFSHEVGALFAGVALASLPYATAMAARLKPLRDFFVVLFFVYLGQTFVFDNLMAVIIPALILSLVVMIVKPFVVMISLGALSYTKLTGFKTAIHLTQISEFSIILMVFAATTGVVDPRVTSIITMVALITIAISSYLMKYTDKLYRVFGKGLNMFERKVPKEHKKRQGLHTAILFGYHNGGHEFLQLFRDMKQRYLVVDYDPEIIEHLELQGIRHAYGDATDAEFLEDINAGHATFVASTIQDKTVNTIILNYLHQYSSDIAFICHAHTYEDALELYDHGASYVILPRFLESEYITSHIKNYGMNSKAFGQFRQRHIMSIGKHAVESEQ